MKDDRRQAVRRVPTRLKRCSIGATLLACGSILGVLGAHLLVVSPHHVLSIWVTLWGILMLIGGISAVLQLRWTNWLTLRLQRPARWMNIERHQVLITIAGLNLSVAARAAAGDGALVHSPLAAPLWIVGIGMTILGCRAGRGGQSRGNSCEGSRGGAALEIAAVSAIFLASLLLRGLHAAQAPYVLSGDEGSAGLYGWEFVQGERNNILGLGWFSFPALYFWIVSLSQAVFGRTVEAIRWISALAGALTVVAMYWTARRWWNRRVALWSALWLTTFHHHLFFSRVAYNNIFDGFFFILSAGALWVGVTQDRRSAYLLAGASLGLSQYFYTTSHLGLVLIVLWAVHLYARRTQDSHPAPGLTCAALTAGSVAMPLALLYGTHPEMLLFTSSRVSMLVPDWLAAAAAALGTTPIGLILEQTWVTVLGFNVAELQGVYYGSGMPLLFGLSMLLACFGFAWALVRIRDPRCSLIWMTIMGTVVVGGLSIQAPNAQRMLLLPPILALSVAYALEYTYQVVERFWRPGVVFSALLLTGLLLGSMFQNARFFFLDYLTRERYGSLNGEVTQAMIEILREQPEHTQVFFLGADRMAFHSIPSLPYLLPHVQGHTIEDLSDLPQEVDPNSSAMLFIVLPEASDAGEKIQSRYSPQAPVPIYNRYGKLLFHLIRVEHP
jgi:4-amino-4-deoxy-L-arabinose transferase-like glycosyltransferase